MQWNATGKLTTKAMLPLQRWTNESAGPRDLIGSRPHITSAVASCTKARTRTIVASQAFICRTPEKPRVNTGRPAASCTRAYTPRQTATTAPAKIAMVSPPRARRGRSATAVAIRSPLLPAASADDQAGVIVHGRQWEATPRAFLPVLPRAAARDRAGAAG